MTTTCKAMGVRCRGLGYTSAPERRVKFLEEHLKEIANLSYNASMDTSVGVDRMHYLRSTLTEINEIANNVLNSTPGPAYSRAVSDDSPAK